MTESWHTVLLYTFSTIPQTLAGAGALLAVVVLHRLGSLESSIMRTAEKIDDLTRIHGPISGEMQRAFVTQNWLEYVRHLEQEIVKFEKTSQPVQKPIRQYQDLLKATLDSKHQIQSDLMSCLIPTVLCILSTIVLLPLSKVLAWSITLSAVIVFLVLILFGWTLWRYLIMTFHILRRRHPDFERAWMDT